VPDSEPEPVIAALEETWSATAQVLEGLHPEAWDLPTDCPGWSVRDHLSHLIGTELGLLGESPPSLPEPMPDYVRNPIGQVNEAWIEARRVVPGTEVLEEFVGVTARRLKELRSFSKERFDAVGWSPIGDVPYRDFMNIRAFDSWVHGQDMRWAVDRPGDRFGRAEAIAIDRVTLGMPFVVGRKVAPPEGTTVVFDVTGTLGRNVVLVIEGGRARVTEERPAQPTITLTMPSEHFVRLGCGRESGDEALASGEVALLGDDDLGRAIVGAMDFMI
jgi:uncharacterized protein (TIGR03083 family)